jgi:hypothetical protein
MTKSAITVTLGGVDYEIAPLTIKYSRLWRETFGDMLNPVIAAIAKFGGVDIENPENWKDLSRLLETVKDTLLKAPDLFADATFAYSAELTKYRGQIEESTTDQEMIGAFMHVLALAYPFGLIMRAVNRAGLIERGTSKK